MDCVHEAVVGLRLLFLCWDNLEDGGLVAALLPRSVKPLKLLAVKFLTFSFDQVPAPSMVAGPQSPSHPEHIWHQEHEESHPKPLEQG